MRTSVGSVAGVPFAGIDLDEVGRRHGALPDLFVETAVDRMRSVSWRRVA